MSDATEPRSTTSTERDDMHPAARKLFGWASAPSTPGVLVWALVAAAVVFAVADLIADRSDDPGLAQGAGFHTLWGLGVVAAALAGRVLGPVLRRREDYYGEGDATPNEGSGEDAREGGS